MTTIIATTPFYVIMNNNSISFRLLEFNRNLDEACIMYIHSRLCKAVQEFQEVIKQEEGRHDGFAIRLIHQGWRLLRGETGREGRTGGVHRHRQRRIWYGSRRPHTCVGPIMIGQQLRGTVVYIRGKTEEGNDNEEEGCK